MNIINKPTALLEQMQQYAKLNKATNLFIDHAIIYMNIGIITGINPVIAYVQYAIETDFGRFSKLGLLNSDYCNPVGLRLLIERSKKNSFSYKRFKSWNDGIQAHFDHLALLVGMDEYPKRNSLDPRHMERLYNICETVEDLDGVWNNTKNYSKEIIEHVKFIQNLEIELENNIDLLREELVILKNNIHNKDIELIKLRDEVSNLKEKNNNLSVSNDEYKYEYEVSNNKLLEYKDIIKRINEFLK